MGYKKITLLEGATDTEKTSPRFGIPYGAKNHTWQVKISGDTPTSITVKLQGSINGDDWFDIDESTNINGEVRYVTNKPVDMVRAYYTMTTEGSTSVSVYYIGM